MNSSLIDSLKAQALQHAELLRNHPSMEKLLKLHSALNQVEDVEDAPRTSIAELFRLEVYDQREPAPSPALVVAGQYFDSSPLDAAKDYLQRRGKSATLDEIIAALKTGSCDPGQREKFGLSMARSTFNFVKLNGDLYDLLERYPNVKEKRFGGSAKRKSAPARVEEIMRDDAPISLTKAVAKAENESEQEDAS